MDSNQPVHGVLAEAMRVSLCLRDEEANASRAGAAGGSLAETGAMAWHGWPYFGPTTTLNAAAYCALVSSVSAAQQTDRQVADAGVALYGSDALERCRI